MEYTSKMYELRNGIYIFPVEPWSHLANIFKIAYVTDFGISQIKLEIWKGIIYFNMSNTSKGILKVKIYLRRIIHHYLFLIFLSHVEQNFFSEDSLR